MSKICSGHLMMKKINGFVLEGELVIEEQEGGYAFPSVWVGGVELGAAVEEMIRENELMQPDFRIKGEWVCVVARKK